jgi:phosphatidylserine/phosphatidylglycerophosphate/cardiolipin synthase-like enzyme
VPELTCALGPDSAGAVLTAALRRATSSIDAAVYEVGPSYRWAFVDAARRGRRVRLLLDAHASDGNAATALRVLAAGGDCRVLGSGRRASHWKLLLIDRRRIAVGSGNLIWRDAPRDPSGRLPPDARPLHGTREWWAAVQHHDELENAAQRAFDTAWRQSSPPPAHWRTAVPAVAPEAAVGTPKPQVAPLVVCVEPPGLRLFTGAVEVANELRAVIEGARQRLFITVPYVHPEVPAVAVLLEAVATAAACGADVRLLLGERPQPRDAGRLRGAGFPIRRMDPRRNTRGHAKGLVTESTAVVGSANWSAGGLTLNWEAALVARQPEAARYFGDAFLRDWETSRSL